MPKRIKDRSVKEIENDLEALFDLAYDIDPAELDEELKRKGVDIAMFEEKIHAIISPKRIVRRND